MTSSLCAHCVRRPASMELTIDGRKFNVCSTCGDDSPVPEPPKPPKVRDRVLRAVKFNPGASQWELMEFLGAGADEYDCVSAHLSRLCKLGLIVASGNRGGRMYRLKEEA